MAGVLRVAVEPVALDEGLWCRTCALPAGARIWFTVTTGPRMTLQSKVQCRDCGGTDVDGSA